MENVDHFPDRNLAGFFFRRVQELGERTFLKLQRGNGFEEISWRDFGARVCAAVLGLYAMGFGKGDAIGIIGENSLAWLCADLATLAGGFPNVIISPALSTAMILKILLHSSCRAAIVDTKSNCERLAALKPQLPALERIIVMEGAVSGADSLSFEDLLALGRQQNPAALKPILDSIEPNDLASIMYTSGSTGEPKGVMRTQGNLLANLSNGREIALSKPDESIAILLSLNHLLGRFGFLKSAVTGRSTGILEATEQSADLNVIGGLSPTGITMVPRVMEKIWKTLLDRSDHRTKWEELERLDALKSQHGRLDDEADERYQRLKSELRNAVTSAFGTKIKYISYGGAPMPAEIMRFFRLIGIPLLGTYGSTECGGVSLSDPTDPKLGSLGKPFPNVEVRIADDGEILVRGPTVTPGYFKDPQATREVINDEGWYHSGDLGRIDSDGCLFVVGRKKDVFYCSDGSNIYPSAIEAQLDADPFIRQGILLGDRRPFMAALIVPDRAKIAAALNCEEANLIQEALLRVVAARIDEINAGLEKVEVIRRFAILNDDFSPEVRSITAFQKVKIDRKAVEVRFQKEIKEIYEVGSEKGAA
jgi:long-chain acyl-CoA synthetase